MPGRRGNRPDPVWGRGKLLTLAVGAGTAVLLLVAGLVLAVYYTVHPARHAAATDDRSPDAGTRSSAGVASTAAAGSSRAQQDALAAAVMPSVGLDASRPGVVSTRDPGVLVMPAATTVGPAAVPTGFPSTPQGALAQLAAIDQTAMQSGALAGVRAVIASWAAPGGPTPESWSAVEAMAEFLDATGLSGAGSGQLALVVTPVMGLIKATVGTDWVIPCVDFEFDATLTQTERVADADCQRMVWADGRWVIGPGAEPAPAPSVWPDTDTAISVGYRDLRHA